MSFGWSAGDIATAITLAYNLIQALDTADGAAGDYRKAVTFLRDLKRTLEPLQTFTAWDANPTYHREIKEQVVHIKEPVEMFLEETLKYEPSLGVGAKEGHHRHIFRKLQWHISTSRRVLELKKQIKSHMRIIDTLMQRLIVDVVQTTQQQLPDKLRTVIQQTLCPELISILQEGLQPLNSTLLENYQEFQNTSTQWTECCRELRTGIRKIEQHMQSSKMTQMRIESCLGDDVPRCRRLALPDSGFDSGENEECFDQGLVLVGSQLNPKLVRESLIEVYYLVFLYLGHFLGNLFLVLSRLVRPTQALMPVLVAQYNISFLDAIGRAPRILPFEYFRSFKVLRAFIEHEFKDLPGSAWVDRGRYLLLNLATNHTLNDHNWSGYVTPGVTVAMSMIVRKRLERSDSQVNQCPQLSCAGTWPKLDNQSWATCPVCQKQILNSLNSNSNSVGEVIAIRPTPLPTEEIERREPVADEDIHLFKRIFQETIYLQHKLSNIAPTSFNTIALALGLRGRYGTSLIDHSSRKLETEGLLGSMCPGFEQEGELRAPNTHRRIELAKYFQ